MTGGSGSGFTLPGNSSSRLSYLAKLLENRAWLRFAKGNSVCLPASGVANVANVVSQRDYGRVNALLAGYSSDIGNLRSLLARCGSRQAINRSDIERAIAVDLRRDGTVILYVL
ncbi:hypothetical protein VW29_09035 [Devosia limi DSM 17137]|uniref:Uncharacterized protein n=1 Tax=Devosia limi DSM 17137 TaxID=1121477 RepID=A0A0F5LTF2_9HYPH|nr:hypothetical protein VW29_09035 [Devosia limi DSM 17137]